MASEQQEESAFDSPSGFALRIKYQKSVLCVPVDPTTTYDELARLSLELLESTDAELPDEAGVESFEDLNVEDLAFFEGNSVVGANGAPSDDIKFAELDRKKKPTISAMGLKDGADSVLYIGFLNKAKKTYMPPDVSIPSINDEDVDDQT
ncbi:uncharacterized protein FA14DRAFT_161413 [Meira miltonrushii]|uniref:Uncharacterized protein n=1 Tax=Meira miltonrushii TaxID=1280837 RepID=A0A316VCG7_9BASI|nr:uncharacterized protein FA14DRAFT_161413 [Meira miltonrushii]PWN33681.1 hypothetical protein FA14DRAFT_161413 [Meira miltonrushii]